jgi:hypothetical protein
MTGMDEDGDEACVGPGGAWDVSNDKRGYDGDGVKLRARGYHFVK